MIYLVGISLTVRSVEIKPVQEKVGQAQQMYELFNCAAFLKLHQTNQTDESFTAYLFTFNDS